MKLKGKKIQGANYEWIVIPRPDGDLVFKAQAVLDMKGFNDRVQEPKPPKVMLPGGEKKEDTDDQRYKEAVKQYADMRYAYMIIKSLEATPEFEWETVNIDDAGTWLNWSKEFQDAGFTVSEINIIQFGVAAANSLNQDKLDEARARFLASQAAVLSAS